MFSSTLAYFSLFSRPLTKRELSVSRWHEDRQNNLPLKNHLFVQKRSDVRDYHRHVVHTDQRMLVAKRTAHVLRHIPFVQSIFLCNTVAMGAASAASDVDLFIVTEKGRLWFTRLMVTLVTAITGRRRSKKHVANKICLSFYVSTDGLGLDDIKLDNDIYLAYWLHTLRPLYDPNNLSQRLYNKNTWARQMIPDGLHPHVASPRIAVPKRKERLKHILEALWSPIGSQLEAQAKAIQKMKMKLNIISTQNEPTTNVIISDTMLKFHENDRRAYYRDNWRELCTLYDS